MLDINLSDFFNKKKNIIKNKKEKFSFYSINDIKFRLVRDQLLSREDYKNVMFSMFNMKKFKPDDFYEILFMNSKQLIKINELGHLVGLHSHTHPTLIGNLSFETRPKTSEEEQT